MTYINEIYQRNLKKSIEEKKKTMRYKIISFNPNYLIFKDGSVYSLHFGGRWLKPFAQKYKAKVYWTYHIRFSSSQRMVYIARLLYFHFKKHRFSDMDEMDLVSYKNNDTNDLSLKNLYLTTQADVNYKTKKMPQYSNQYIKIKDTEKNIQIISKLLSNKYSYKKIGFLFSCSEMSVHRFIKRNQLKEKIKLNH